MEEQNIIDRIELLHFCGKFGNGPKVSNVILGRKEMAEMEELRKGMRHVCDGKDISPTPLNFSSVIYMDDVKINFTDVESCFTALSE